MKRAALFVAFLFVTAFLLLAATSMRPFGGPTHTAMDDYFIAHSQSEIAANNVVTAVVFDYRGFDTLGEATVLFTAVIAVLSLFRKLKEDERWGDER
jgi:multisubunit Na+/H+ antiporter MnhB subunit